MVSPPFKQGYLGGGTTAPSPFTSGNSLNQLSTGPTSKGLVSTSTPPTSTNTSALFPTAPNKQTQTATTQQPTTQTTAAVTTPVIGGANSGGTTNPNYGLQTQGLGGAGDNSGGTPPSVRGLFPNVVSSLAGMGTQPGQAFTQAQGQAEAYNSQLQSSLSNEANALKTNYLNPIPIGDQEGRAAVMRNQYLAQQQALGAGFQGASNLVAGANTQQGLQQSALNQAGGFAQPQQYSLLSQPYNPVEDTYGGGGASGATGRASQAGAIQAAQSNAQTGGTAATNSYAGIYDTANKNAANFSQQQSAINAVGNQALGLLNSIPGRSSSQFVNAKLNQLATQFSSPEYAAFNTAIQSLQARIGQALQAGEIPTAATGNAQAIANGNITVGALASTLQQVDKEMGAFVSTQNDLANYAKGQIGTSGGTTGGAGATSGGTGVFSDQSFYGQ